MRILAADFHEQGGGGDAVQLVVEEAVHEGFLCGRVADAVLRAHEFAVRRMVNVHHECGGAALLLRQMLAGQQLNQPLHCIAGDVFPTLCEKLLYLLSSEQMQPRSAAVSEHDTPGWQSASCAVRVPQLAGFREQLGSGFAEAGTEHRCSSRLQSAA